MARLSYLLDSHILCESTRCPKFNTITMSGLLEGDLPDQVWQLIWQKMAFTARSLSGLFSPARTWVNPLCHPQQECYMSWVFCQRWRHTSSRINLAPYGLSPAAT